jgi:cellulose synthase/poly-beta-1,6-N-acetylglucosamine synthase-like glycosyltransferase
MFIRKETLKKLDGFSETHLAEDMDLSARLAMEGYKIKYAPDVKSWQENPSSLEQLFHQRTKWYRGWIEAALKYGKLMTKPTKICIDAEVTLLGPFMLIASIVTYFAAFQTFITPLRPLGAWQFLMQFSGIITTLLVCSCAMALIYMSKPRKLKSIFWLPFIYFYWCLQAFVALYAVLLIIFRRPGEWSRTKKTGTIANSDLVSSEFA